MTMDRSFIRGVIPPIVTPVDDNELVHEAGLKRVIDHVLAGGVHGILALGSTGEFWGFPHDQAQRALAITLAQVPNIAGVKDSSGDMSLTAEYIRRTLGTGFRVMAGRDILILATLTYGGVGCVASTANVVPALVVKIFDEYTRGNLDAAREAQF